MLRRSARLLLVLTSLAPHALIYGAAAVSRDRLQGTASLAVAFLLAAVGALLIRYGRKVGERRALPIQRSENLDRDALTLLLTYLFPLLAGPSGSWDALLGLLALLLVLARFLYVSDMLYANPLVILLGYHAIKVIAESDNTYVLLTRSSIGAGARDVSAVRITPSMWLEV